MELFRNKVTAKGSKDLSTLCEVVNPWGLFPDDCCHQQQGERLVHSLSKVPLSGATKKIMVMMTINIKKYCYHDLGFVTMKPHIRDRWTLGWYPRKYFCTFLRNRSSSVKYGLGKNMSALLNSNGTSS